MKKLNMLNFECAKVTFFEIITVLFLLSILLQEWTVSSYWALPQTYESYSALNIKLRLRYPVRFFVNRGFCVQCVHKLLSHVLHDHPFCSVYISLHRVQRAASLF